MRVLGVEVVNGLLPRPVEQGGQLAVGPVAVDPHRTVAVRYSRLRHVVDVELDVHLGVLLGPVRGQT